jgi:hypothetical protein
MQVILNGFFILMTFEKDVIGLLTAENYYETSPNVRRKLQMKDLLFVPLRRG